MLRVLDVTFSYLASIIRLGAGTRVGKPGPRPAQPLQLYEYEGCPFCRKVREALTNLALSVVIYPCPKGGPRYREEVVRLGGRMMFPYLIDPNTGTGMYESGDIVRYLFKNYGSGRVPISLLLGPLFDFSSSMASLLRLPVGRFYRRSRQPQQALVLYSYEGCPFSRIVRETLCDMEIPYLLHNLPVGAENSAPI